MPGATKSLGVKEPLDKFYTLRDAAQTCLDLLDLSKFERIIEPSAGSGAFSNLLLANLGVADKVVALDIAPENPNVTQQDWFSYTTVSNGDTLVVGNPPFGRQHSLALRFINHAFTAVGAHTVAFVLPRGFRKESVQDRVFPHAELVTDIELANDSFTLHGEPYSLPTVFQIWQRTTTARPRLTSPTSSAFVRFVHPDEPHDVVVRRVGGKAGSAFPANPHASQQSNYFLHITSPHVTPADVMNLVNDLTFTEVGHTTGPLSLSKREFVRSFDRAFADRFRQD